MDSESGYYNGFLHSHLIFQKAFTLLAVGGEFTGVHVNAIGYENAMKIMWRANREYWRDDYDEYTGLVDDAIISAGELEGSLTGCPATTCTSEVENAFAAVQLHAVSSNYSYILGDVDADGQVTVLDIVIVVDIILGEITPFPMQLITGDINNDGSLDVLDLVTMVYQLLYPRIVFEPDKTIYVTFNLQNGIDGKKEFVVRMLNQSPVKGLELDFLPITNQPFPAPTYSDRANDMEHFSNDTGEIRKIILLHMDGNSLTAGSGELLKFAFDSNFEISSQPNDIADFVKFSATNDGVNYIEIEFVSNEIFEKIENEFHNLLPEKFALHEAFPNPFNPVINLSYSIPENGQISLTIFNMLGREAVQLVNTYEEAGYHSIQWDATSFASGVYMVKLVAGDFSAIQKVTLVK